MNITRRSNLSIGAFQARFFSCILVNLVKQLPAESCGLKTQVKASDAEK